MVISPPREVDFCGLAQVRRGWGVRKANSAEQPKVKASKLSPLWGWEPGSTWRAKTPLEQVDLKDPKRPPPQDPRPPASPFGPRPESRL